MTDGPDFTPREAWQRWIDHKRIETTEQTIAGYYQRIKRFVDWCEARGIDRVDELDGWRLDEYETHRRGQDVAAITLSKELGSIRQWIEYLERIEAVDDGLAEKVPDVHVDPEDRSSDAMLEVERARRLLQHYRRRGRGTRAHAFLEIAWFTGARLGAIRGLDRRDFSVSEQYVDFRHRPESDTPLKNKSDGERVVALPAEVVVAVEEYLEGDRWDKRDEHGREPLLTSRQGRLGINSVRRMSYAATLPCNRGECPHGQDIPACDYREPNHESKCPSSRSPHRIRTGSISWQLDCGIPIEIVAERANVSPRTLARHYDKTDRHARMERRRRQYVDDLSLSLDA